MLNKELHKLAKSLSLTDEGILDPYILTPEEEKRAVNHAIEQSKKLMAVKMRRVLKTQDEILHKISLIDWDSRIYKAKILHKANMMKNQELWHKAQRQAEISREESRLKELQQFWTYARIYKLMKYNSLHRFGNELIEDSEKMPAIKALCFFLSRDDRFATELGFDRLKGILMRGPSGTGKTHLVRCVEDNGLNPILFQSMLEITDRIKEDGRYQIPNQGQKVVFLDDVGFEETKVNHYGTVNIWFKEYIGSVYERTKCYNHLIVTTNLNFNGIEEQYGYRVASRMREMFNVVNVTGKDLRDMKNHDL